MDSVEIIKFFKTTKGIIAGASTIVSAVMVIGAASLKHDANVIRKFNEKSVQQTDHSVITYLKAKNQSDSLNNLTRWHDLYDRLDNISDSLFNNFQNNNTLTDNYVQFAKKHSLTIDEFASAVNGLNVSLIQTETKSMDKPEYKIRIEQVIKKK